MYVIVANDKYIFNGYQGANIKPKFSDETDAYQCFVFRHLKDAQDVMNELIRHMSITMHLSIKVL